MGNSGNSSSVSGSSIIWVDKKFGHLQTYIDDLRSSSFVVNTVKTNEDAISALNKSSANCVITNLERSTPLDGFLLIEELKRQRFTGPIIVYSVTARNDPEVTKECIDHGAYVACNLSDIDLLIRNRYDIPIQKINNRLSNIKNYNQKKLAVLLLSGSFNPIHHGHITSFNIAKQKLENDHHLHVIGGFVAPSSDGYVSSKLQSGAMSLQHRNLSSRLATLNSDWIDILPWGIPSSTKVRNEVEKALKIHYPGLTIQVLEMCGADHAAKYNLWRYGEAMVCIGRQPYTTFVAEGLQKDYHHQYFILIEEGPGVVSSTDIRNYLNNEQWDELKSSGLIDPLVVDYLKILDNRVFLLK